MDGYKTWTGIALAIAGTLGLGKIFGSENLQGIVDTGLQLFGFIFAAYGNYKAHQTITTLSSKVGSNK